jgi:hypothetical protein
MSEIPDQVWQLLDQAEQFADEVRTFFVKDADQIDTLDEIAEHPVFVSATELKTAMRDFLVSSALRQHYRVPDEWSALLAATKK